MELAENSAPPVPATVDESIFVAIAAYREPELGDTITSCIENASQPDRLRFGVLQQFDDDIEGAGSDAIDQLVEEWPIDHVRVPHPQSRGGCWARHAVQRLYDGEAYTLQIDAHSRMGAGWDDEFIALLAELPSEKPLVTGFPALYEVIDGVDALYDDPELPVPLTVIDMWAREGWIRHPTVPAPIGSPRVARRTRVLSGAFVFTLVSWNIEVRQDPEHLYTGEEFALTLRSFTSGYDLWNPPRRLVWHRLHPATNPKYIHDDPDHKSDWRHRRACSRLRTLLRGDPDGLLGPYGLGADRTLAEYGEFSGLDCEEWTIAPAARIGIEPSA